MAGADEPSPSPQAAGEYRGWMTHWHHVLVERRDDGTRVLLGAYLSSGRQETREEAAEEVTRLLGELTQLDEAALASARDLLISEDEGVQLARWARAAREIHLVECDGCEDSIQHFRARMAHEISQRTGRPVSFLPPPPIG